MLHGERSKRLAPPRNEDPDMFKSERWDWSQPLRATEIMSPVDLVHRLGDRRQFYMHARIHPGTVCNKSACRGMALDVARSVPTHFQPHYG